MLCPQVLRTARRDGAAERAPPSWLVTHDGIVSPTPETTVLKTRPPGQRHVVNPQQEGSGPRAGEWLDRRAARLEKVMSDQAPVLVAEDSKIGQQIALAMLEKLGYEAYVAANGREAIDALSRLLTGQ